MALGRNLGDVRDPLYLNSIFLMANAVAPPALAFFFWVIVARYFTPAMVGEAVVLLLPATLLATASSLGLHIGLVRFLPRAGEGAAPMVASALVVTALVGLGLAAGFLAAVPFVAPTIAYVSHDPGYATAFVVLVEATGLAYILDSVFIAHRRASLAFLRGVVFALVRIPLPLAFVALAWVAGLPIFLSYALGGLASLGMAWLLLARTLPGSLAGPGLRLGSLRRVMVFSLGNHLAVLAQLLPSALLPLMIIDSFGPRDGLGVAAYFYMAWQGALILFIIPAATSVSLLAEGSHGTGREGLGGRRALFFIYLLLLPAVALTIALAPVLLGFFGQDYALGGTTLLRLFALAALPTALNNLYVTGLRLDHRIAAIVAVGLTPVVVTLAFANQYLPALGLAAIGVGWVLGHGGVALAVALLDWRRSPLHALRGEAEAVPEPAVPSSGSLEP